MSFLDTVSPNIKVTEYLSNIPLTKSILRTDLVSDPSVPVDWIEYKTITIDPDKISDELIDFPLMINISDSSGYDNTDLSELFTLVEGDYTRIQIRANDDITPLYTEVEKWDVVNGSAILNTKIPIVSSTETTVIKIFYKITDGPNEFIDIPGTIVAENVWDDNFSMVQHMSQDLYEPAPQIIDSTDGNHDGTTVNMQENVLVDGLFSKAVAFDGLNEYVELGNVLDSPNEFTISALVKIDSAAKAQNYVVCKGDAVAGRVDYIFGIEVGELNFQYNPVGTCYNTVTTTLNLQADVFYNIACKITQTTTLDIEFFVDGVSVLIDSLPNLLGHNNYNCFIGHGSHTYYFDGIIDDVRFSNIARSSSYIAAENYTLRDNLVTYDTYVPPQQPE